MCMITIRTSPAAWSESDRHGNFGEGSSTQSTKTGRSAFAIGRSKCRVDQGKWRTWPTGMGQHGAATAPVLEPKNHSVPNRAAVKAVTVSRAGRSLPDASL